nr:zinc finger, CCHC-type [Tanacetum cinerariifolium]
MGDENLIRTLGDYFKPSHEGYRNTIELPTGNNVSEDPNQHLEDFLKLLGSLDLDAGSITIWEDLTTRFFAQLFPPGRIVKLRNNILMFQQHHGESLSEAWTHFKNLLRKVPHHGIDLWLQVQIFYDRIDHTLKRTVDYAARGRLRKLSAEKAWATIEEVARYEDEGWNDLVALGEGSLDYKNLDIEHLLGVMECKVDTLMNEAISLMGRSESIFGMTSNTVYQLPLEPSLQKEFENLVMNSFSIKKRKLSNSKSTWV